MPITRRKSVRASMNVASPATTAQAATQPMPEVEELPTMTAAPPALQQQKRAKLGWQIRADLIKQCKQMALDEGMHDYEVLEMLLEESLMRRREQKEI